jgi:hypothetical protein
MPEFLKSLTPLAFVIASCNESFDDTFRPSTAWPQQELNNVETLTSNAMLYAVHILIQPYYHTSIDNLVSPFKLASVITKAVGTGCTTLP